MFRSSMHSTAAGAPAANSSGPSGHLVCFLGPEDVLALAEVVYVALHAFSAGCELAHNSDRYSRGANESSWEILTEELTAGAQK